MKLLVIENPRPFSIEHCNDVANAPLSASLNSGYALAIARAAGCEAIHLDFSGEVQAAPMIAAQILAEQPDLVLFHWVYAWGDEARIMSVVRLLKQSATVPVGACGLFPTLAWQRLFVELPELDFVLVGEFEVTLAELLAALVRSGRVAPLPGLALPGHSPARRELLSDLGQLPIPDDVGTNCAYPTLNLAASRGCFGDCSFCFINVYYGCSRRRERDPASLARELDIRLARREIRQIYFIDPTFVGHGSHQPRRMTQIGRLLQRYGLPFGFESRADTIDESIVAMLAGCGATSIFLGIESGCSTALQRMNKSVTPAQIERAVKAVRSHGIRLSAGFIMFEPDTTIDELLINYAFLERLGLLDDHDQTINMLYHSQIVLFGSKGWQRHQAEGRLLIDPVRPFEAHCQFRDGQVELVCSSMRRVATAYFTGMAACYRQAPLVEPASTRQIDGHRLNRLLKEAFLCFVDQAGRSDRGYCAGLVEDWVARIGQCLTEGSGQIMPTAQASPAEGAACC